MKYTLKNKEIELTDEEVKEIVKQNSQPKEEKKMGLEIKNRFTGNVIFTSTKTMWKEAVEEAVNSEANLREADLSRANLREADLSGADLSRANLRGAYLSEANLSEADLIGANLSRANLREAYLIGANLSGADLIGANLSEANLIGANLSGANLREAELQNARFYGRGGTTKIKKSQVDDFFKALGVIVEN